MIPDNIGVEYILFPELKIMERLTELNMLNAIIGRESDLGQDIYIFFVRVFDNHQE